MTSIGNKVELNNQIKRNREYFDAKISINELFFEYFTEEDISAHYLSWLNNSAHMRHSDQQLQIHTYESSRTYLKSFDNTPNLFLKVLNKNLEMIGTLTIYIDVNHGVHSCGILIDPDLGGMGYGKSAWNALVNEICPSLGARKIVAGTLDTNHVMIKLFQSSQMRFEARLISEKQYLGKCFDVLIYSHFPKDK